MDRTAYRALHGTYVAQGYAPDGDSIRFALDRLADLDMMNGTTRLHVAMDSTVQLRLERIDAPELHYRLLAQRLGREARDAALRAIGFRNGAGGRRGDARAGGPRRDRHPRHRRTRSRDRVRVCRRGEAGRRIVGQRLDAACGDGVPARLRHAAPAHRALFATLARKARRRHLGVWQLDRTRAFPLATERSIGPRGALVFPKLFRRCIRYLADRFSGYPGG